MSSSVVMERPSVGAAAGTSLGWQPGSLPASAPAGGNWCVLPRCELRFEKCNGGFKIHCVCEDDVSSATLQNLCRMLCDGLCSCCCTANGIPICQCNLASGRCTCEITKDGCCISCISGDKACAKTLQACCDCLSCCCEAGSCCYISFNNTPICCGKGS